MSVATLAEYHNFQKSQHSFDRFGLLSIVCTYFLCRLTITIFHPQTAKTTPTRTDPRGFGTFFAHLQNQSVNLPNKQKSTPIPNESTCSFYRSGETRTRGLLLPKQARYQLRNTPASGGTAAPPKNSISFFCRFVNPELVGARPLHLACGKTVRSLKSPAGAFIAVLRSQTRTCRGEAPPSCLRKTLRSLKSPTGAFIAALRSQTRTCRGEAERVLLANANQLKERKPLPMISLELTMVMKLCGSFSRRKLRSCRA